jgi:hypothetical protein
LKLLLIDTNLAADPNRRQDGHTSCAALIGGPEGAL